MTPIGAFACLLFAGAALGAQAVQPLRADGIELEIRRRGAAKAVKVPLELPSPSVTHQIERSDSWTMNTGTSRTAATK